MQAEIAALKEALEVARSAAGNVACPPPPPAAAASRAGVWVAVVAAQLAGLAVYLTAVALCSAEEHIEWGALV